MATGMRLAPAPVISMVSWACADASAMQDQHADGQQGKTTQFDCDSKHGQSSTEGAIISPLNAPDW
jgi:hypothetical protein